MLITWPDFFDAAPQSGALLAAAGLSLRHEPKLGERSAAELRELLDGAVAAIVSTDPFDASVFDACPALRVIARVGVGVDSIDLTAATAAGVAVTTTPGANDQTTADHTVALMLAAVRRIAEHDAAVRRGDWTRTGVHVPGELAGHTVGLIGCGRIGTLVAERLAGFRVRVLVCDPDPSAGAHAERVTLPELLATSDIVSIHVPLQPNTRGLIGARELAKMGQHALLVNTARGGIVDEEALVTALERHQIAGAALDVFESEPPRRKRLLSLRNVVLTPHTGGISDRSVRRMLDLATESVLAVLRGETPSGLANLDVLSRVGLRQASAAPVASEVTP